eukprot:SAG31_NODE_2443_length_5682_cov_3.662428_5_plen_168_part_00
MVSGGKGSTRGTMFAAYELLREMGCKFLAYDYAMAEELPLTPPSSLPAIDKTYGPLYEYRDNNEWAAVRERHRSTAQTDASPIVMCDHVHLNAGKTPWMGRKAWLQRPVCTWRDSKLSSHICWRVRAHLLQPSGKRSKGQLQRQRTAQRSVERAQGLVLAAGSYASR